MAICLGDIAGNITWCFSCPSASQVSSSSVASCASIASHHPCPHRCHQCPNPMPWWQLNLQDPPCFAAIISEHRAEPMANNTHMGDCQSRLCCVGGPWPCYSPGQFF